MVTTSSTTPPRVSIIILNWNGRQHLAACLPSLFAQTYGDFEILLVDNGSEDGSVAFVQEHFPQVHLIQNPTNRGFAAANNQAILCSQAEFVALLNNDTVADPHWLEALVRTVEQDRRIGTVASKMLSASQPGIIDSAGIAIDRTGLAWEIAGGLPDLPKRNGEVIECFGASAGAALYRRAMLEQIGLLDEDFFAYLEDVDLAWRAQWAGWRCVYASEAVVWHHHSATSNRIPHFKSRLLGRNKLWLLAKNYPFPPVLWYLPLIILFELMALLYAWRERRLSSALAGRIEGFRRLPAMLRKRRTRIKHISEHTMMAKLQPVEPPQRILQRYAHLAPPPGKEHAQT